MTNAAAALALHLRRAGTEIAGVDETWTVTVPDTAAADSHLALYRDDERTVTATLYQLHTGGQGSEWVGTGRAGQGTVNIGWAG